MHRNQEVHWRKHRPFIDRIKTIDPIILIPATGAAVCCVLTIIMTVTSFVVARKVDALADRVLAAESTVIEMMKKFPKPEPPVVPVIPDFKAPLMGELTAIKKELGELKAADVYIKDKVDHIEWKVHWLRRR